MNMQNLMSKIMGFVTIIVTLGLAPSINTANTTVAGANLTNCIGMSVMTDFGAPLCVLGLLAVGGIFVWKGTNNQGFQQLLDVISLTILVIIGLTFMSTIVDYTNTLIGASTGFALIIYGLIPLVVYLAIIASVFYSGARAFGWKGFKKGRGRMAAAAQANY